MGNIMTYLEEFGGYTFAEKAFNEVDGLILAHFCYYIYDSIIPPPHSAEPPIPLLNLKGRMDENNFTSVTWEMDKNIQIFDKIIESRRYRSAQACCYVSEIDAEKDMQFSALTLLLGNGDIFVGYRGTDDALVGWKEDFYMAYRTPVAAQERSRTYLEDVAHIFYRKRKARYYIAGHSKGGNLAAYAAMTCDKELRRRIGAVYNCDGPGFRPDFLETLDYEDVRDKIVKLIPKESFVGMLMQDNDDYVLIESDGVGVLQHITHSWSVEGDAFVRAAEQEPQRRRIYERVNEWIFSMEKEQIGSFLDSLFGLLEATQVQNLSEFSIDVLKKTKELLPMYLEWDDKTKLIFWEMCTFLVEIAATDQRERLRRWKLLDNIRSRIEVDKPPFITV